MFYLPALTLFSCLPASHLSPPLQLAEFESDAMQVQSRRYVVRMLSYPTVCVSRSFLDGAVAALQQQHAGDDDDGAQTGSPPPRPMVAAA